MTTDPSPKLSHPLPEPFHTTRWTRVCLAKADSDDGRRALADLCDAYYEPVVAYLRRALRDSDAARDMSHAFFAAMLQGGTIQTADPSRGRFRSYLLGAVKHFLSHQREAMQRLKRGGGHEMVPMDHEEAVEVADQRRASPDAAFDKQWAVTVLGRALESLQEECRAQGRGEVFERVKPMLTGECDHGEQAAMAAACGLNAASFRMTVHRLRKRLRQCVKREVAGTLEDPAMVEEEMAVLFAALGE
jgi:RNA polymerase sigma factor (sigma-70 family)